MSDDRTKIRLPPRVRLRAMDSALGSYPTIARVGDPDFQGNYAISYNDTKTIIFTGTMVNYPTLLRSGSMFLEPDITSSITIQGNVRKGIADEFVTFVSDETLSSFNESRHPEIFGHEREFYETGSSIENVGEGFTSPLRSKVKIEINLEPYTSTRFGCDNENDLVIAQRSGSFFMVYYNFDLHRWEGVGKGWDSRHTTLLDIANPSTSLTFKGLLSENYDDAPIGFGPSMGFIFATTPSFGSGDYTPQDLSFFAIQGRPLSNFGFPMHQKFHATSSQTFDVSKIISHPMLVEKMIYEFSASYEFDTDLVIHDNENVKVLDVGGSALSAPNSLVTSMPTFFILNQRRPYALNELVNTTIVRTPSIRSSVSTSIIIPGKHRLTSGTIQDPAPLVYVDTSRDLVTYAQMLIYSGGLQPANGTDYEAVLSSSIMIRAGLGRELNIIASSTNVFGTRVCQPFTGSFMISGTIKQTPKLTVTSPWIDYSPDSTFQGGIGGVVNAHYVGGRTGTEMSVTGRDLVGAIVGDIPASGTARVQGGAIGSDFNITPGTAIEQASPYLIKPGDKLVFGWQAPISTAPINMSKISGRNSRMQLHPGKGKLILYGSLIKEGCEFIDTRNPPLTSLAVHEDIHSNNPVLDQFDTEPRQQFSGSYIGEYVTGSVVTTKGSRKVIASTVSNDSGIDFTSRDFVDHEIKRLTIPGFVRFKKLTSESERFFDTVMPQMDKIVAIDTGYSINFSNTNDLLLVFGHKHSGEFIQAVIDDTWNRAFPFEPRYSTVPRLHVFNGVGMATHTQSGVPLVNNVEGKIHIARMNVNTGDGFLLLAEKQHDVAGSILAFPTTLLKDVFCVGDYLTGSSTPIVELDDAVYGGLKPRGFKYGVLNALPQFSCIVMRHDEYGQFRDMLEQRFDAKFFDVVGVKADGTAGSIGVRSAPVQVRFVKPRTNELTDPYATFSSNMSIEATSSIPYFDGIGRNRNIPPEDDDNVNVTVTPMLTNIDLVNNVIPKILLPPIVRRRILAPLLSARRTTGILSLPNKLRLSTPSLQLPQLRLSSVASLPPALVKFRRGG